MNNNIKSLSAALPFYHAKYRVLLSCTKLSRRGTVNLSSDNQVAATNDMIAIG